MARRRRRGGAAARRRRAAAARCGRSARAGRAASGRARRAKRRARRARAGGARGISAWASSSGRERAAIRRRRSGGEYRPARRQNKGGRRARIETPAGRTRRASKRSTGATPVRRPASVDHQHAAAVLRPRGLVRAEDGGALLAVADRRHAAGVDALRDEVVLRRGGAALAEPEVVLARAALVAVTLDRRGRVRVLLQEGRPALDLAARLRLQLRLVVVEEHAVADFAAEDLLPRALARRGGRGRSRGAGARGGRALLAGSLAGSQHRQRGDHAENLEAHFLELLPNLGP